MNNQGFTSTMDIPVNLPSLPEEYPDYSSADYWDQRYSRKIQLTLKEQGNVDIYEDWYLQYEQLKPFLLNVPKMREDGSGQEPVGNHAPTPNLEAEILVIGCGLSSLSEDISALGGFECITNLDFSQTVQEHIEKKYSGDKG